MVRKESSKNNGGEQMLSKIKWYLKQLLPLYYTTFYNDSNNQKHFTVWQMWFGKTFNVTDVKVLGE